MFIFVFDVRATNQIKNCFGVEYERLRASRTNPYTCSQREMSLQNFVNGYFQTQYPLSIVLGGAVIARVAEAYLETAGYVVLAGVAALVFIHFLYTSRKLEKEDPSNFAYNVSHTLICDSLYLMLSLDYALDEPLRRSPRDSDLWFAIKVGFDMVGTCISLGLHLLLTMFIYGFIEQIILNIV